MSLKLYNTLTRKKEEFQSLTPGKVSMYVCGPTVYDYIHIGNARPPIFFDVVRRYLEALQYEVHFVVNFTDVDDKLIKKAQDLGLRVPEVADRFIQAYFEDTHALGVHEATVHPRVMENIPEIIEFIEGLVNKGFAYSSEGDVYFRTTKFADYGKLSHQKLEELQHGIRIEVNERKEQAQDFVLWKNAKPGEISWTSPWGEGRPGWHIECSAMVKKYLGETIDIHGGGHDLQFPHHECEVAQSEALHGKPLANYWLHNGYIHINNEKMSKSLGNGIQVHQLLKTVKPEVLRFFMLSTHYRSPLNFSEDIIKQSEQSLARIENCLSNLQHRMQDGEQLQQGAADGIQWNESRINELKQQFHEKMQDDFNTPDAITVVFDLVSETNHYLQQNTVLQAHLQQIDELFQQMNEVLGILAKTNQELLDAEVEQLIHERTEARTAKNWARADEIRDLLQQQGILLEDTPQGMRWRRK
jgi:cysteinyl-tRNA synthetase